MRIKANLQNDTLWRLDAHFLVVLWVGQRKFDRLLDLLNLRVQATDIRVGLLRGLLELHHSHHRIGIVAQDSNDGVNLVVEQDGAARLQLILVDERQNANVVFASD